jgi:hypothetical protein
MHYVMSLSGGVASAVASDRAIQRYGREAVTLFFADTSAEDPDLHRFLHDLMLRWGGDLVTYKDGRTPLEVAEDRSIIPNQRIAPCTKVLKIDPFVAFITTQDKPLTVLLGLDWREQHRMARPTATYSAMPGVSADFPLMWKPIEWRPYVEVVQSWGIAPPAAYAAGFGHNNCLAHGCVKMGIRDWLRFRDYNPAGFAATRDWEQAQRAKGGPRADYAIVRDSRGGMVKPYPLAELEAELRPEDDMNMQDDLFSCMCAVEA